MNNFLLALGALLVGILAALAVVPMVVDWNSYRGVFEEEASRLLGRDVRVGGGVNLRILPVPYVRFEKLRIADTASTGGDPLFRAESVTMRLSIAPLLRGVLEAQSVELKRPTLRLAVDQDGRGNWRTLALKPGSLPFVPADVALQSVGIDGGTLVFSGPTGADLVQLDGIGGEFSADSIEGPFKFKGTALLSGVREDIRVASSTPESDGTTRFKATLRTPSTQNTFAIDGRILDLKGRLHVDGDLTAKLAVGTTAKQRASTDADAFDLKARFDGDLNGVQLSDIALSLDNPADPQLVTGTAKAAWGNASRIEVALATRSFNLDRFSADEAASDPLMTARNALDAILALLPADAETSASFKADRLVLGSEPLSGVTVVMARRGQTLEIDTLKAALPGATHLVASGTLTRDAKSPGFAGPISLRGSSLGRFLGWSRTQSAAAPVGRASAVARYDGPFALEGQLTMTGARVELTRAQAEVAGLPMAGELRYSNDGRRRFGLVLEGGRIDANQLWPGGFDVRALAATLAGTGAQPADTAPNAFLYGVDPDTTDLDVIIRAGELQLTTATNLRGVDTAFTVERGKLSVPRLRFSTATGLTLDMDGEIAGIGRTGVLPAAASLSHQGRGTVRWVIGLPTPQAVDELAAAIDWPATARPEPSLVTALGALGNARLAGSTLIGARGADALDITVDGSVEGGRVEGSVHLDHGLTDWATAPLDVHGSIETANLDPWMSLAGLASPVAGTAKSTRRGGRIAVNAEGQPRTAMAALVSLSSEAMAVTYQGRAALPASGGVTIDGAVQVSARDAADALALVGISLGSGPAAVPLTGTFHITRDPKALTLATVGAKLGSSAVSGSATLGGLRADNADAQQPPRSLDARIAFDTLSVQGLLAALSDRSQESGAPPSPWPGSPLKVSDTLTGKLALTAGSLILDRTIALTAVSADIALAPGTVTVGQLSGTGLGGKVTAHLELQHDTGGVGLTGTWALADGTLSALAPGASGPLAAAGALKSQGLSASMLIANLQGTGEAKLGAGAIRGIAPGGLTSAVNTVMASKDPIVGDNLSTLVRGALAESRLPFAARQIPFTIGDGTVKIAAAAFPASEGRATLATTIDLTQLSATTDWRIEAQAQPSPGGTVKPALPAVVLSFAEPLATTGATEGRLAIGSFEQELVVRKLEHDSAELERLRKLDEERRRKEDADRIKAAAEAAPNGAAPPANGAPTTPQGGAPASVGGAEGANAGQYGNPQQPAADGSGSPPPTAAAGAAPAPPVNTPPVGNAINRNNAQGSTASRRRAQEGFPQPFQNNF